MAKKSNGKTSESITILIHGTFSRRFGRWHVPGSPLHQHIRQFVFPDVYCGQDYFDWSGGASDADRECAAANLIKWCDDHPAKTYNLIGHSHGANVANIASNTGLNNIKKLVFLSPPVWEHDDYLPNMDSVEQKTIFNFHAARDFIVTQVANPRAAQNYQRTSHANYEREFVIAPFSHWAPLQLSNWVEDDIGDIISIDGLFDM